MPARESGRGNPLAAAVAVARFSPNPVASEFSDAAPLRKLAADVLTNGPAAPATSVILATKASLSPFRADWYGFTRGKSAETARPVTLMLPL